MTTRVHPSWVSQVLSHIPARVLTALDAWSYRVARKRAERRRVFISARERRAAEIVRQYRTWSE
jgi:hypothetical protein